MGRLHRDVMRVLVGEIVSGTRAAGTMLPREVDLAAGYDVSRGIARETVRALEERGLISVRHGVGATINPSEEWDLFDAEVLAALLDTEAGDDVLADYLDCRRVLEVEAAGLAARRCDATCVEAIAVAYAEMEAAVADPSSAAERRFHEADVALHHAVMAASGNRALALLAQRIHDSLLIAREPLARPEYRVTRALPEHRRILIAISVGDVEAACSAMNAHLDTVADYLSEYRRTAPRRTSRRSA